MNLNNDDLEALIKLDAKLNNGCETHELINEYANLRVENFKKVQKYPVGHRFRRDYDDVICKYICRYSDTYVV